MCGMLDFLSASSELGHWIPAKAGMTGIKSPYAVALNWEASKLARFGRA